MLMRRRHVILIIILSLAFFFLILFKTVYYAGNDEIAIENISGSQGAVGSGEFSEPIFLSIPKIGVNADVQEVGITAKGNMATPKNYADAGWYKFGVPPGEMGSAVIAGHVNNGLSLPAVFARLGELEPGDDIYVVSADGLKLRFIVRGSSVYDFNEIVPEIFRQDDGRYLRLITCTGLWQESLRTHNKRLVVTAELAG